MTLTAMRTMLANFLKFDLDDFSADASGAVASADATEHLNYGIRTISKAIYQFDPSIVLTLVADQQAYDLRTACGRKVREAKGVIINGNQLFNAVGRGYGMWAMGEADKTYPSWRSDPSGTPTKAFQVGTTLYLHSKPSAAIVSGGSNYVAGVYMAANMTNGADDANSPDIPEELHESIVRLAAIFAANPNVSEQEGLARLDRYNGQAGSEIQEMRRLNYKLAESWGTLSGSSRKTYILS